MPLFSIQFLSQLSLQKKSLELTAGISFCAGAVAPKQIAELRSRSEITTLSPVFNYSVSSSVFTNAGALVKKYRERRQGL